MEHYTLGGGEGERRRHISKCCIRFKKYVAFETHEFWAFSSATFLNLELYRLSSWRDLHSDKIVNQNIFTRHSTLIFIFY